MGGAGAPGSASLPTRECTKHFNKWETRSWSRPGEGQWPRMQTPQAKRLFLEMVLSHLAKEVRPDPRAPETPQVHSGCSVRIGLFSCKGRAPGPRLCLPSPPTRSLPPCRPGRSARCSLGSHPCPARGVLTSGFWQACSGRRRSFPWGAVILLTFVPGDLRLASVRHLPGRRFIMLALGRPPPLQP